MCAAPTAGNADSSSRDLQKSTSSKLNAAAPVIANREIKNSTP